MMKAQGKSRVRIQGVRARMLLMLAVLSLPLLIISLLQLNYYRSSLGDRPATITTAEANAAALALGSWLNEHSVYASQSRGLSSGDALDLFRRLARQTASDTVLTVLDSEGRTIGNPLQAGTIPAASGLPEDAQQQRWSDGILRMTSSKRVPPYSWSVVVGVPLDNAAGSQSLAALTATWAFVLLSSILLGVWAVGRFTKPLRHLAASASALGAGSLNERVAIETSDEVGSLANDFNAMAAELEAKFGELREQSLFTEEVLDSLPLGLVVLDANLIVRKSNPTFGSFIGREPEKLKGRGLYEAAAGFWRPYTRGQAYLKLGKGAEAAAEFQKILDHRGWDPLSPLYPLAHLGLARKAYQDFFALWKDADADLPILIAAKKEYEKVK